jgi:hypothetical protein
MTTLRKVLVDAFQPRPVPASVRARRLRLCEFIRRNEHRVYDVDAPDATTVRALLGWDDETMSAFVDSPLLCNSSPHAAMNSFPPMLAFPWVLRTAVGLAEERHGVPAVHVRTQCTHHDFGDTFSRPHAWWHRAPSGEVVKTRVFTRQPIKFHPVLGKPAPRLTEPMLDVDRQAVDLAELGTDYATFCVIYRAFLERHADLHAPHRTIELPIDLLNRFTIAETGLLRWFDLIADAGMTLRVARPDAPLVELSRAEAEDIAAADDPWPAAIVGSNMINFAQFYLLGLSLKLGGRSMAVYVPEMNEKITGFLATVPGWDCEPPEFLPFTSIPVSDMLGLQDEAVVCQEKYGFPTSLPLILGDGDKTAGAAMAPLADADYDTLYRAP